MLSDSEIRERLGPLGDPPSEAPPPSRAASLIATLLLLVLLLWGGSLALIVHLEKICPPVYDQPSGHLYYFSDHRPHHPHIVYHTAREHYTVYAAVAVSLLTTLVVAIFAIRKPAEPAS